MRTTNLKKAHEIEVGDELAWGPVTRIEKGYFGVTLWFRWNGKPLTFYSVEDGAGIMRANADIWQEVAMA